MRAPKFALALIIALAAATAHAHGPQIQITRDGDKITTRRVLIEEPYSSSLSAPTRVYVIPLLETGGVWYSRPNRAPSPVLPGLPAFLSGPGIAYGYDQADGGPRGFASGNHFDLNLIDGLQWWNGSAFEDPGLEEIEAFRSSGSPAVTNDSLTPGSPATLSYSNVSASYNAEVHSSASFRLLGDGASSTAEGDDGVYLLSMTYSSTQPGLAASDPFYFVLHKNANSADIEAAVGSLGFGARLVQYVPEPSSVLLLVIGCASAAAARRTRNHRKVVQR
jgi:hypothetical protein